MTHPSWFDLARCWLAVNVMCPALVVYPRDDESCRRLMLSWGVDPVSTINAEFVVVRFESESDAAAACHDIPEHVAYAMVWSGSEITTENV